MKRFEIDTNFNWLGVRCPSIYRRVLRDLALEPGEKVVVYQDEDEWTGTVCFDSNLPNQYQWYIILDQEKEATHG